MISEDREEFFRQIATTGRVVIDMLDPPMFMVDSDDEDWYTTQNDNFVVVQQDPAGIDNAAELVASWSVCEVKEQCVICLESGGNGVELPCSHKFHNSCIIGWLSEKAECPL